MACSAVVRNYTIPKTDVVMVVCDSCLQEAINEIKLWQPASRLEFIRHMDLVLPDFTLSHLDNVGDEARERFCDYILLYIAYELEFGNGVDTISEEELSNGI